MVVELVDEHFFPGLPERVPNARRQQQAIGQP